MRFECSFSDAEVPTDGNRLIMQMDIETAKKQKCQRNIGRTDGLIPRNMSILLNGWIFLHAVLDYACSQSVFERTCNHSFHGTSSVLPRRCII